MYNRRCSRWAGGAGLDGWMHCLLCEWIVLSGIVQGWLDSCFRWRVHRRQERWPWWPYPFYSEFLGSQRFSQGRQGILCPSIIWKGYCYLIDRMNNKNSLYTWINWITWVWREEFSSFWRLVLKSPTSSLASTRSCTSDWSLGNTDSFCSKVLRKRVEKNWQHLTLWEHI